MCIKNYSLLIQNIEYYLNVDNYIMCNAYYVIYQIDWNVFLKL